MGFGSIFGLGRKNPISKLDLWRIKDQIISDGDVAMLTDKDLMPLKLMYLTQDVMDGDSLQVERILNKHGYQDPDIKNLDGYLITGEIKGRYLYAEGLLDFKNNERFEKIMVLSAFEPCI